VAGADNGDAGLEKDARVAANVEDERRVIDLGEVLGVESEPMATRVTPGTLASFFNSSSARRSESRGRWIGQRPLGVGGFEFGEGGAEDVFYTRDALKKAADTGGTELRSERKGKHLPVAGRDG